MKSADSLNKAQVVLDAWEDGDLTDEQAISGLRELMTAQPHDVRALHSMLEQGVAGEDGSWLTLTLETVADVLDDAASRRDYIYAISYSLEHTDDPRWCIVVAAGKYAPTLVCQDAVNTAKGINELVAISREMRGIA
jgi:hypothetical protein